MTRQIWRDTTDPTTDLTRVAERFLAEQNVSRSTKQSYTISVHTFLRYLTDSLGRTPTLADFSKAAALEYRAALEQEGKQPGTVHTRLNVLKRLANWLVEEKIAKADVLDGLPHTSQVRIDWWKSRA